MARYRIIRPEFWWDEKMDTLTDTEALAFIALWNHVDDEGRHRYSPRELEMKIPRSSFRGLWPHFLTVYEDLGIIVVYEVAGKKYFHIRTWFRHQYINKPTRSILPSPPDDPIKEEKERNRESVVPLDGKIPYKDIIDLWNSTMGQWCPSVKFDPHDQILLSIRSAWMSYPERQKLEWWKKLFMYMSKSPFLKGESRMQFVARLRWTLIPENTQKIMTGQYHDSDKKNSAIRRFTDSGKTGDPDTRDEGKV